MLHTSNRIFIHFIRRFLAQNKNKINQNFHPFFKESAGNFFTVKDGVPCVQGFVLNSYWIIHTNSPKFHTKKGEKYTNLFLIDDGLFPYSWYTKMSILHSAHSSCLIHRTASEMSRIDYPLNVQDRNLTNTTKCANHRRLRRQKDCIYQLHVVVFFHISPNYF